MQTSKQDYKEKKSKLINPLKDLFGIDEVRRIDAIKFRIPLFDGAICKSCGTSKKININSDQWSNKGHHDGECYNCYQVTGIIRQKLVRAYIKQYPYERKLLSDLVAIRQQLSGDTGEAHHIHHIIPKTMKSQFPNPEHNDSATNKIVVSVTEHGAIHQLIRSGTHPRSALNEIVSDLSGRIANQLS